MGKESPNPFSELMRELERRGEELVADASERGDKRACAEKLASLVAEGEQRFAELLAQRQGALPLDFESLYRQKAELEHRLLGHGPAPERHWLSVGAVAVFLILAAVGSLAGIGIWATEGHGASLSRVAQIKVGMTADEVSTILGNPSSQATGKPHGPATSWYYTRMTACCVKVYFDEGGRVQSIEHDH